jgi:hydroxymethylbilane synthase
VKVRVGSRRSRLARTQTEQLLNELRAIDRGYEWEVVPIETTGDVIQNVPLREAGGKGLFVKELDEALLDGRVDCAVHSLKDVPTELPDGIMIGCIPQRADCRDLLLSRDGTGLGNLQPGSRVGTTSLRRAAQLLAIESGLRIEVLRGNVETRLRRLVDGDFDLTLLAAAGLDRLGVDIAPVRAVALAPETFVPAPGQGMLAVTIGAGGADTGFTDVLEQATDPTTFRCAQAERAAARLLGGSCHLPVAVYATCDGESIRVTGLVATPDGATVVRDVETGQSEAAEAVGERLGERLLSAGAGEIVAEVEEAAGRSDSGA